MRIAPIVIPAILTVVAGGCAAPPRAEVDRETPLRLVDTDGAPQDLDAILAGGKNVALVFWQTWCKPCRNEAPALAHAAKLHGDAIRFVGVVPGSVDQAEVVATAKEWGLTYPQVIDGDLALTTRFDVDGTPTLVVLGPGRKILHHDHHVPEDWTPLRGSKQACVDGVCPIGQSPEGELR